MEHTHTHAHTSSVAVRLSDSITAIPMEHCWQVWPASQARMHQPATSSNPSPDRKPHVITYLFLKRCVRKRKKRQKVRGCVFCQRACMYISMCVQYMHTVVPHMRLPRQGRFVEWTRSCSVEYCADRYWNNSNTAVRSIDRLWIILSTPCGLYNMAL